MTNSQTLLRLAILHESLASYGGMSAHLTAAERMLLNLKITEIKDWIEEILPSQHDARAG